MLEKNNRWYYSFEVARVDGKRKRVERIGGDTKKKAEKVLREALREYETDERFIEESKISVSDFFDYWFNNYVDINCKYNTKLNYKGLIEKHIKPSLDYYKLKDITPKIIQEFITDKHLSDLSKSSLTGLKSTLSRAFICYITM